MIYTGIPQLHATWMRQAMRDLESFVASLTDLDRAQMIRELERRASHSERAWKATSRKNRPLSKEHLADMMRVERVLFPSTSW